MMQFSAEAILENLRDLDSAPVSSLLFHPNLTGLHAVDKKRKAGRKRPRQEILTMS